MSFHMTERISPLRQPVRRANMIMSFTWSLCGVHGKDGILLKSVEGAHDRKALPGIRYFSGMFLNPISVPASLNNFSSCFTIFMHTGAPAQACANSSSVLYFAFICSLSGTTLPLRMVFPSWQDSQCLCHEFTDWPLEQPEIKQNAKIRIMIKLLALGLIHLSSSLSVDCSDRPLSFFLFYHVLKLETTVTMHPCISVLIGIAYWLISLSCPLTPGHAALLRPNCLRVAFSVG